MSSRATASCPLSVAMCSGVCPSLQAAETLASYPLRVGYGAVAWHLVNQGADVSAANKDGRTPLELASISAH